MNPLRELAQRAEKLAKNWEKIRGQSLENTKEIAIDLITDDQLFDKGIDGAGRKLDEYRSREYENFKALLNPNRVTDLRLSGDYVDSHRGTVQGDNLIIDATDQKEGKLLTKYGADIQNLTDENTKIYAQDYVLPELIRLTLKEAGL